MVHSTGTSPCIKGYSLKEEAFAEFTISTHQNATERTDGLVSYLEFKNTVIKHRSHLILVTLDSCLDELQLLQHKILHHSIVRKRL